MSFYTIKKGKKTKAWEIARARLKNEFEAKGITRCENCGEDWALSFHHRNKRRINDEHIFENVILLCGRCHGLAEYHRDITIEMFNRLRPK